MPFSTRRRKDAKIRKDGLEDTKLNKNKISLLVVSHLCES